MAVPDYETLMLPVLSSLGDGQTLSAKQLRERVAEDLGLSAADRAETIASGAPVFNIQQPRALGRHLHGQGGASGPPQAGRCDPH